MQTEQAPLFGQYPLNIGFYELPLKSDFSVNSKNIKIVQP